MGSVKDLEVIKKPSKGAMGIGRFHFSDRYSVFDWGEMPDLIDGKGAALCMMGAYCFERLEEKGVLTREGRLCYDYSVYTLNLRNFLIPLEIIYRNGLPEGSSVFKRLEQGRVTVKEFGLDHYPKAGERLVKPIFDVSTKLEEGDRYVTWEEAKGLAGLTYGEVVEIQDLLLKIDKTITEIASRGGLVNEDGKIELAFDPKRRLMVVDVVGTLDECRFTYNGLHVSKEIARQFYRKTGWYRDVEEAKKRVKMAGIQDWRKACKSSPPKLDLTLKTIISEMYLAAANDLTNRKLFNVPNLMQVIKKYRDYVGSG
jgi:phosphoribosylaminoimidazole-succinocarboxamide synthase